MVHSAETHKGKCQQAGGNESYCHALHALGYAHLSQLLAYTCKYDKSQSKTNRCCYCINHTCEQVRLQTLCIVSCIGHQDGYAQNAAVCGNKRQEYAQCLIQRRRNLFEYYLKHLNQTCNHKDEHNCLQIAQIQRIEHPILQSVCHNHGNSKHKRNGQSHTYGGTDLL